MAVWVTGGAILAAVGAATSPENAAWAEACALAVSAGIDYRLTGVAPADPPVPLDPADYPELTVAAQNAGVEAYKRREAIYGLTGYVDLEGAAIRVARDYLQSVAPIIARYATTGIA